MRERKLSGGDMVVVILFAPDCDYYDEELICYCCRSPHLTQPHIIYMKVWTMDCSSSSKTS